MTLIDLCSNIKADYQVDSAGAVVTHDVPSLAVVAGNPTRILYIRDKVLPTGKK